MTGRRQLPKSCFILILILSTFSTQVMYIFFFLTLLVTWLPTTSFELLSLSQ